MTLHQKLSIRECNYVESLLEEEQILQTNIHDLKIQDHSFSRSLQNVGLPNMLKVLSISSFINLQVFKLRVSPTSVVQMPSPSP